MAERVAGGGMPFDCAEILDGLGHPVLVIDRSFRVVYMNAAARTRYGSFDLDAEERYCHALAHGLDRPCFSTGEFCPVCAVFETGAPSRAIHSHVGKDGAFAPEEITTSPLRDGEGRVAFVVESVRDAAELLASKEVVEHMRAELDLLRGVLPTCAGCKRIRSEEGQWEAIESYVAKRSGAEFSHGLCPDCVERLYPEFKEKKEP
jgi:hypothetical protein